MALMTIGQNVENRQRDSQAGREGFCVLRQIDRLNPQSNSPVARLKNHINVPLRKTLTDGLRQTAGNNREETSSVLGRDERRRGMTKQWRVIRCFRRQVFVFFDISLLKMFVEGAFVFLEPEMKFLFVSNTHHIIS